MARAKKDESSASAAEKPKKSRKKSPGMTRKATKATQTKKGDESDEIQASLSFEGALAELERTVSRLEEGEMPLEEALELFESGVKLSKQCNTTLEAASARIEILVGDSGSNAAAFQSDEEEDDEDEFEDDFELEED